MKYPISVAKKIFNGKNFPLGIFIGFVIGISFAWILDGSTNENWVKFGVATLAAATTLLASSIALAGVMFSLEHQRERSLRASRALLPMVLANLHRKSLLGFRYSKIKKDSLDSDIAERRRQISELEIEEQTITILKENIQHSDDVISEWLSVIVAYWQIQIARFEGFQLDDFLESDDANAHRASEWLLIHTMVSTLWNYARNVGDIPHILKTENYHVPIDDPDFHTKLGEKIQKANNEELKNFTATGGSGPKAFRDRLRYKY